jgi:hypothetical protein
MDNDYTFPNIQFDCGLVYSRLPKYDSAARHFVQPRPALWRASSHTQEQFAPRESQPCASVLYKQNPANLVLETSETFSDSHLSIVYQPELPSPRTARPLKTPEMAQRQPVRPFSIR